MDKDKVRELIHRALTTENPNSNENLETMREALLAVYEVDDFPSLYGLEHTWKLIEPDQEVIDRENFPGDHPLASLAYYVEGGFYPPPEILLAVERAYHLYTSKGGDLSLDEAFFGKPHKKTSSYAYRSRKLGEYRLFHSGWVLRRDLNKRLKGRSMEELAQDYFDSFDEIMRFENSPDRDVDTFLRNYRRWVARNIK